MTGHSLEADHQFPITPNQLWLVWAALWLGITGVLSFVVPVHLAQQPWAIAWTNTLTDYIPAIRNLAQIPGYSSYALFAHAMLWSASPVFVVLGVFMAVAARAHLREVAKTTLPQLVAALLMFGAALGILLLWPVGSYASWRDSTLVSPIGFFLYTGSGSGAILFVAIGIANLWLRVVKSIG